ncbi:hypothetical protein DFR29_102537 [Tahibacter aquaticus]|uniref:Uncharacterized protein n=1 Tax=Tahibacter aquaticus TaxID=520092 RepID=A0A4R6Z7V6_9GAMM|nr:hypothetical protein [Tahibacter aquaticus]TDR47875.1 hypothetical protein DFR29_102537 [Tahibacter aquaticus]
MIRPELRNFLTPVRTAAVLVFALATAAAQAAPPPDASLVQALEGIWQGQRPAVTRLSEDYTRDPSVDPPRYTVPVKDAPEYVALDAEHSEIELGKKRFVANESPWGPFPLINTDDAELLEINFARKRYVVISAIGAGLYGIGDWQRFGFLHVIDVSNRGTPVYYPLFAEAGMRDKVLGRLPNSAVLNFARLVPSRWANNTQVNGYEVLLYSLQPRGPERVIGDDARPLAYTLTRDDANAPWVLARTPATPIANVRDDANRAFSAPPMKNALPQTPVPASSGGTAAAATAAPAATSGQAQAATDPASDPAAAKKKARKDKNDQRKKEVKDAASEIAKDAAKDAASEAASEAAKKAIPSIR